MDKTDQGKLWPRRSDVAFVVLLDVLKSQILRFGHEHGSNDHHQKRGTGKDPKEAVNADHAYETRSALDHYERHGHLDDTNDGIAEALGLRGKDLSAEDEDDIAIAHRIRYVTQYKRD